MPQYCPVCRTPNPATQRYCLKCGHPFYQSMHPAFKTAVEKQEADQRNIFSEDENIGSLPDLRREHAELAKQEQGLLEERNTLQEALRLQKIRLEKALQEQQKLAEIHAFQEYSKNYHALFDSFLKESDPQKDQPPITYDIYGQTLEVTVPANDRRKPYLLLVISREKMGAGIDKSSQFVNLYRFLTSDPSGKWVANLDRLTLPAGRYYVRLTTQHKEGKMRNARQRQPHDQRKVEAKMLEITLR